MKNIFLLLTLTLKAQLGYEWIDFTKDYIRVKVYEDGIYYLTQSDLTNAGMPSSIDPRTLRLFHQGKEQNIWLPGESDGRFDTTDTLYFYGKRNDGTLDTLLYVTPSSQPHKKINIHSDTSVYFINWGGGISQKRVLTEWLTSSSMQSFHIKKTEKIFLTEYCRGEEDRENRTSTYGQGEGWSSSPFSEKFTHLISDVFLPDTSAYKPELEFQLVGRNNYGPNRRFQLVVKNPSGLTFIQIISGFTAFRFGELHYVVLWSENQCLSTFRNSFSIFEYHQRSGTMAMVRNYTFCI